MLKYAGFDARILTLHIFKLETRKDVYYNLVQLPAMFFVVY
jgi:hypothetical protein